MASEYFERVSGALTLEQLAKIDKEAREAVFESCRNDTSYLKSIVREYLGTMGAFERAQEIAGGELEPTVEILGFDPTTGEAVGG